jgi:hypothetical protein
LGLFTSLFLDAALSFTEDGGNALVCLREVESGLYSSSFPVTPAFLAALRSEIDENGVDGEGSSVDAGSIGFSFGGKGGFTPMGGNSSNSSTLATGKGSNGSGNSSGGGMAGEVYTRVHSFLALWSYVLRESSNRAR